MRQPRFWYTPPAGAAQALTPISRLWEWQARRRSSRPPIALDRPTICVGNLTIGGTGKTPTVIALAERLTSALPHIVSRGYGGSLAGPLRVDLAAHDATRVGDEALLHARVAPTWVARDRPAGAKAAIAAGAGVVLFDDGHQTPRLHRDLALLVVDAEIGFGNRRTMPAGPLRECLEDGLARADLVIAIGPDHDTERFLDDWDGRLPCPSTSATMRLTGAVTRWDKARIAAFAGIGRPDKFFAQLQRAGADIVRRWSFPDHRGPTPNQLAQMADEAAGLGAELVATEKDIVRLPPPWRQRIRSAPMRIEFNDWSVIAKQIRAIDIRATT